MGCAHCIEDVAGLVCSKCHDWANDLSERVHGKMVRGELASEGLRLVLMIYKGSITVEQYKKLWAEACQVERKQPERLREVTEFEARPE